MFLAKACQQEMFDINRFERSESLNVGTRVDNAPGLPEDESSATGFDEVKTDFD